MTDRNERRSKFRRSIEPVKAVVFQNPHEERRKPGFDRRGPQEVRSIPGEIRPGYEDRHHLPMHDRRQRHETGGE